MKTKKFALLVGTLFLVGNIVLPTLVAAQETQTGSLQITAGTKEIYYDNYGVGSLVGFNMVEADGSTLAASAFEQDSFSAHSADAPTTLAPWDNATSEYLEAFIGVADFTNSATAWNLQAQVDASFVGGTNTITLTDTNFKMATASGTWGENVTLTDNQATSVEFTALAGTATTNDVYFYVDPASAYSPGVTDFSADLNVDWETASLDAATTYTTGIRTAVDFLQKANVVDPTPGIFGVAVNYYHLVAAGTPADTYVTDVTYTLLPA